MSESRFKPGEARAREAGRKGGRVTAAQRRQARGPYDGNILDLMDVVGLTGPSWTAWRAFWKAVYAGPLSESELAIYRRHTGREAPPSAPVRKLVMVMGRRSGKTLNNAVEAAFRGVTFDASEVRRGELVVIPVIAADRRQARQVFGYLRGIFEEPEFGPFVHRFHREVIELRTGVNIEVHTASYRTVRGYTIPAAFCDELAHWWVELEAANPDHAIINAIEPGQATIRNPRLVLSSTPYAAKGELFRAYERSFGQDDPHTLVWLADSRSMNPGLPRYVVERAFEDDPVAAASEYGQDGRVVFRRDIDSPIDPEAIAAVTVAGRREIPPMPGVRYFAFVDPSGGSQDSFTLAIAHRENELAVLDAVREVRPPFSPDSVVQEFAELLRTYGCMKVTGDRYGGEWPRERFRRHGIEYVPSEPTKSDLYRELVAPINAGRVALLDLPVLRAQLVSLERRVARGGRDSIDHGPGGRDDVANAVAGALVNLLPTQADRRPKIRWA